MSHTIAAELVANVGEVLVAVGDAVGPADTLVILESMKMEIPVLAEVSGVVRELAVSTGDVIREGDIIAVIDTGEPS
ncbi:MAG: biotin/lipoyl-binding carrier protein [Jatrophihabitantaceae bacterium]